MRVIYFILILCSVNINCDDEDNGFITVIAPKTLFEKKDYNLVLIPSNVEKRTEVAFNFRKSYATTVLHQEKMQKFNIKNTKTSGSKLKFALNMTLFRNITVSGKSQPKCISSTIQEINSVKDQFYTFIQTDKPIYKPGDEVKFRVLILDKDLKPYHINNINVNVTDPLERIITTFDDPDTAFSGLFNSSFKLSSVTALGIWKIRVIIDKKPQFLAVKPFNVQKYILPPFSAHIESNYRHLMTNTQLELKFYGRYSFGEYVPGHAQLIIQEVGNANTKVYLNETYQNVGGVIVKKFRTYEDLKIKTSTEKEMEAELIFTEAESEIVASKKIRFTVHGSIEKKVKIDRPEKFMAGMPYGIKVSIVNWDQKVIMKSPDPVNVVYEIQLSDGSTETVNADVRIVSGVITHSFIVPENATELTLKLQHIMTTYETKIEMGKITIGESKIRVSHTPKNPEYNQDVTIHVKSDTELDQVIAIVMTRHGSISSNQRYCNWKKLCKFTITITKDMMPISKVLVYYVENQQTLHKGETNIKTKEISANKLSIEVPATAKIREPIEVSFFTKAKSEIFLLAIDKRLTYLGTENEVTKQDVATKLIDYDGDNEIRAYPMNDWKDCTEEELNMIVKGRQMTTVHGGELFTGNEDFGDDDDFDIGEEEAAEPEDTEKGVEKDEIRENFPEVWIYDDFKAVKGNFTRTYITADTITSWKFSAFAMHKDHGLAVAEPAELIVKKPFFVRVHKPYSIRFNEVLKLDILVHNYLDTKETLSVKVDLLNTKGKEFQFVNYNGCAISSMNNDLKASQTVSVPFDLVKKVTFYIRSYSGKDDYSKIMRLIVDAKATTKSGSSVSDKILEKLKVEPIGVKKYDIKSINYNLAGKTPKVDSNHLNLTNHLGVNTDEFPRIKMEIEGDYLSDTINVSPTFDFYPSGCTEQRTSKLKAYVEYVKYLKGRGRPVPNVGYTAYYQGLLATRNACTYYIRFSEFKSYYIEALASGMHINILPVDKPLIQRELDQLKGLQTGTGTFSNYGGIIPSYQSGQLGLYYQTAYCLIPFVKFKSWIGKNYDDVIKKGMDYLKDTTRINEQDGFSDGIGLAAYIAALNGETNWSKKLLEGVEKNAHFPDTTNQKEKCLKRVANEACDLRHTAYASLTYLILGDKKKAQPLIAWLLKSHSLNKAFSNSIYLAIAAEAISKFVTDIPAKKPTDFTVAVTNEHIFNETVRMTTTELTKPIIVNIPDYSLSFATSAAGNGYCSITTVIEKTISVEGVNSKFKLDVNPKPGRTSNERIVEVCATYAALDNEQSLQTLVNVIYDVDMPSGYEYVEVVSLPSKKEIRIVEPRHANTKVQIYYNDFTKDKKYCVDIRAKKILDVKNIRQAGVMVYDYEDKTNIAVDFFKFVDTCAPK